MGNAVEAHRSSVSCRIARVSEIMLRAVATLLSIAGALVMAKNKQDTSILIGAQELTMHARHTYLEAFVFLVYANGIAAIYCFMSLLICCFGKRRVISALLFLFDQALAYLLLAAAACSTEASYIAKRGESHVGWNEVCSSFKHFCDLVAVSLVLTFLSMLAFGGLAIMSSKRLFGHCRADSSASV
ncbi:hypothetical protein KP509_11G056300 [Ceratopteris richardii]|uniref:CASP-like protein n=1 Tax=Ceratopteris richardii TaxID=49495 RepID=A0A8T2TVJ8_CERRI|nr:hypothetical protein KP509_11G056300 [Ceratopteris richardii]